MKKTESEQIFQSVVWWNVDRVNFLTEKCNITPKDLLKFLSLDTITGKQLKQFSKNGQGLTEEQLWVMHHKINGFFRT